jgi:hypothetical protein
MEANQLCLLSIQVWRIMEEVVAVIIAPGGFAIPIAFKILMEKQSSLQRSGKQKTGRDRCPEMI